MVFCGKGPLVPFVIIEKTRSKVKPPFVSKHFRNALSKPAKHAELNCCCCAEAKTKKNPAKYKNILFFVIFF